MTTAPRWHDLMPRILSGIALAMAGAVVVWLGGPVYVLTACAAGGVMIWESGRMFGAPAPRADGALAAAALGLASLLPGV